MLQLGPKGQKGFAVVSVLLILLVTGFVVVAFLRFAPVNLRAAQYQEQSVRALANAESGLAYALAWIDDNASRGIDFTNPGWQTSQELGEGGGYRGLSMTPRGDSEYVITAVGYQQRPGGGGEITRQVQTAIAVERSSFGALFTVPFWAMAGDEEQDLGDHDGQAPGMVEIEVLPVPYWDMPNFGLDPTDDGDKCQNAGSANSRDVTGETCIWPGDYSFQWATVPATIDGARMLVEGNMNLPQVFGGGTDVELTASNSEIGVLGALAINPSQANFDNMTFYTGGDMSFGGSNVSSFEGVTNIFSRGNLTFSGNSSVSFLGPTFLYVDGNVTFGASADVLFAARPTIYINGNLTLEGNERLRFLDGATFHVSGNVNITGSGWTYGTGEDDAPWIVFYVGKQLTITGGAGAGANMPDAAFLLDTSSLYEDYPVRLSGSGALYGGVYAPTRNIYATGNPVVEGSLIGEQVDIPHWRIEDFIKAYYRHADRMRSFRITDSGSAFSWKQLPEWAEVR